MSALSVPASALTRGTNGEEVLIPQLGLGTYKVPDDEAERVVHDALEVGYRHIDTAQMYGNEAGVGRAIAACDLPRRDLFITSKLNNPNHRRDDALRSFDATMKALRLEVLDLFLVHWPLANSAGIDLVDTWHTMIRSFTADGCEPSGSPTTSPSTCIGSWRPQVWFRQSTRSSFIPG